MNLNYPCGLADSSISKTQVSAWRNAGRRQFHILPMAGLQLEYVVGDPDVYLDILVGRNSSHDAVRILRFDFRREPDSGSNLLHGLIVVNGLQLTFLAVCFPLAHNLRLRVDV